MRLVTAEMMREMDRIAIQERNIPSIELMENAALGVAEKVLRESVHHPLKRGLIVCGRGNNGGDGIAVARLLASEGLRLILVLLCKGAELKGDPAINFERLPPEVLLREVETPEDLDRAFEALDEVDFIVDAILGTGMTGEITGLPRKAIELINAIDKPVFAVDIPTGVNADTGAILGDAVRADFTATFGMPKVGLYLYPGADCAGEITVIDIGIPDDVIDSFTYPIQTIEPSWASESVKPRDRNSHKVDYGRLLVAAGKTGMLGAAYMVCQGALRAGVGLVTAAVIAQDYPILATKLVEGMTRPVSTGPAGTFHPASIDNMTDLLDTADALAVGPGIGTEAEVVEFLNRLLSSYKGPVVIDADGIKNLRGMENLVRDRDVPGVITPHPGEFTALTGIPKEQILADRVKAASDLSRSLNTTVVLKGARTVIAEPGGNARLNLTGNPGMASGGSGDVLTGIIAGLIAQGYAPFDAACLGVFLHGLAGDLACAEMGEMSLIASDLIDYLPKAFAWLKELG
jgi:hydroxyethylthiazole kinase-like uncharacterized protein yjeF